MKHRSKSFVSACGVFAVLAMLISVISPAPMMSYAQGGEGDYSDSPDHPVIFFPTTGVCVIGASVSRESEAQTPDGDADDGVTADGVTLTNVSAQAGCSLEVLVDGELVFATTQILPGTVTYSIPEVSAAFGTKWIRAITTEIGNPRSGEVEDWGPDGGGSAPPESPPYDLCEFVAELVEKEAKKIQENGGTVATAQFAVAFSPLSSMPAGKALGDYLSTLDPNDPITDEMIQDLGDLVRDNWEWNPPKEDDPKEEGDPPEEDKRMCGGFISARDYCLDPGAGSSDYTTEDMGDYEVIHYGAGQIFVQEITGENGISPELDCELYSTWFSETYGNGDVYTFVPGLVNETPVCRNVISGEGFYQHEMAFWNQIAERAFGMSVFAEDLPTFMATNEFLIGADFRPYDSSQ